MKIIFKIRMLETKLKLFFIFVVLIFISACSMQIGKKKPNIIIVFADDLGYGDLQCYNPESKIPTPNLNSLAEEGIRFTDAHTSAAVCTPSRYSLLTGRYCWRSRLKRGVLSGYSATLIEKDIPTIGHLLQDNGYHTTIIGKWHLGVDWVWKNRIDSGGGLKHIPEREDIDYSEPILRGAKEAGFDYSYILPGSLDMGPYTYLENNRVVDVPSEDFEAVGFPKYIRKGHISKSFSHEKALAHLTTKVVKHIRVQSKKSNPFFLYFPLTAPHKPVIPSKKFKGKSGLGDYGDFVMQIDWVVGEVKKAVKSAGIEEETIIMVSSDNGSFMYRLNPDRPDHTDDPTIQGYRAENHKANGNLRGTKADIYEGGHRVPFIFQWKGANLNIKEIDQTVCLTDVLATIADIVNADLNKEKAQDSYSFAPLLHGNDRYRPAVVHHSARGHFALRDGKWKLIFSTGSGGRAKPRGKAFAKPYQLYDMENDPAETVNLAEKFPEIVEKLELELEKIRKSN